MCWHFYVLFAPSVECNSWWIKNMYIGFPAVTAHERTHCLCVRLLSFWTAWVLSRGLHIVNIHELQSHSLYIQLDSQMYLLLTFGDSSFACRWEKLNCCTVRKVLDWLPSDLHTFCNWPLGLCNWHSQVHICIKGDLKSVSQLLYITSKLYQIIYFFRNFHM